MSAVLSRTMLVNKCNNNDISIDQYNRTCSSFNSLASQQGHAVYTLYHSCIDLYRSCILA
jgi:hypothetical protein